MNGWPWMAFRQCSAMVQTQSSPIIGAWVLHFAFIFLVVLVLTVKLVRTFASCQVDRGLEGCIASPLHQAQYAH